MNRGRLLLLCCAASWGIVLILGWATLSLARLLAAS